MTGAQLNHGQCLNDEDITDYLEGGVEPAIKAATEGHLVTCNDCRSRLAYFIRLLDESLSVEEAAVLSDIEKAWTADRVGRRFARLQVRGSRKWKTCRSEDDAGHHSLSPPRACRICLLRSQSRNWFEARCRSSVR